MVQRDRARFHGSDGIRERETRVVGRGVEVARSADESLGTKTRLQRKNRRVTQTLVTLDVSEERERVVHQQTGAELPPGNPRSSVHRPCESQRPHQVGCESQEMMP